MYTRNLKWTELGEESKNRFQILTPAEKTANGESFAVNHLKAKFYTKVIFH